MQTREKTEPRGKRRKDETHKRSKKAILKENKGLCPKGATKGGRVGGSEGGTESETRVGIKCGLNKGGEQRNVDLRKETK